MTELAPIAVRAAKKAFSVLTHQPSGEGFDKDGNGLWPADQFTYRLLAEGAIELQTEEKAEAKESAPPAKLAKSAKRSSAKAEPAPTVAQIAPAEQAAEAALLDPTQSRSHAADAPSTAE